MLIEIKERSEYFLQQYPQDIFSSRKWHSPSESKALTHSLPKCGRGHHRLLGHPHMCNSIHDPLQNEGSAYAP